MPAVHPVDLVAVGDVEVGRLLGDVAVQGCHRPPQCHERGVVERAHVGRDVGLRVAVRPQDELPVGVEGDVGPDLLDAVHHAPVDEVAHGARLGRGERGRAAVRDGAPVPRRPPAAAPAVSVVAVEVRVHGAPGGVALQVLAPRPVWRAGEVVAHAVGVEGEDDEHLARVHEACHGLVRPVVARQPAEERERLLGRQVLPCVMQGVDQDLRLRLVLRDVVADLGHPDVQAQGALADREQGHDRRVVHGGLLDLVDQLRPVVVPAVGGGPVRLRGGDRGGGRQDKGGGDQQGSGDPRQADRDVIERHACRQGGR